MSIKKRASIQFHRQVPEATVVDDSIQQEAVQETPEAVVNAEVSQEPAEQAVQDVKVDEVKKPAGAKPAMTEEDIKRVLRSNPELIETLVDATTAQKIFAVGQKPGVLAFIKDQTPEVVKAALDRSISNFRYVQEQTAQMCEEVVQLDVTQLQWVKDQTEELCAKALQWSPTAIVYIRQPTEKMKLYAIERYGMAILHIKDPSTKDLQTAAIHHPYVVFNSAKFESLKDNLTQVAVEHYKGLGIKMEDVMSHRIRVPYNTSL